MRPTLFIFSITFIVLGVGPAMAAPAGDTAADQRARAAFHRGVQLYNEGSIEAALAEFNKANQLSPNYRLLYNIAQTQFELHDYVGAAKTLKQYLREGGSEIAAERRAQVAEMNRKLEERIGQIEIACNLDGAEIRIDDLPVGVSPLASAVAVNAGPRRIAAIKAGYPTAVRLVTVPGMEKTKVALEIEQANGDEAGEGAVAAPAVSKDQIAGSVDQKADQRSSRGALIASAAVAGGCAVATGVFAILALQAENDFDRELKAVPTTKDKVDDARSKMKLYAHATDAFGAATLLSAGVAVYFLLTASTESDAPRASSPSRSIAVAPTVGGLVLQGAW